MRGLFLVLPVCGALCGADPTPTIRADLTRTAPDWALLERRLIETMDRAGEEFVRAYADPNGELRWKQRYEGGMNSSDDAYEGFRGFSLHHALGGSKKLDVLHRRVWEGITKQFTRYGQIYREFDSNWDWMHHGEGYVSFYPFGLADPYDEKFRERAERFAKMYIGEDPEAPNYDPEKNIIRAVMNGSRGPKMQWVKRDWIPTNANLVYYHLPFDDIPGVSDSTSWINDHPDDDHLARIVKVMSERMARGDVPINMTAVPLVVNAYLYTGDAKYAAWVEKYVGGWVERTKNNNGITPDNVGLSGQVGEYTGGTWWGGYYGWKWVRGGMDIVLAALTGAKGALLVTGDYGWLELPRGQLRLMQQRGRLDQAGRPTIPIRYDDTRGWNRFVPEPAYPSVNLWAVSQAEQDWAEVERLAEAPGAADDPDLGWALFARGRNEGRPARAFRRDLRFVTTKLKQILNEHGDPETWYDAHWLALEPMPTDNLVRFAIGGLPAHKRGELVQSRVRYFDPDRRQPGLPQGVAALVTRFAGDDVELSLVNINAFEMRRVLIQAGGYAEHRIDSVRWKRSKQAQPPGARTANALEAEQHSIDVGGKYLTVELEPGAGTDLRLRMTRYVNQPAYSFPWREER